MTDITKVKQANALNMLRRAAKELNPQMELNTILRKTVEMANELMESTGSNISYFSHIAVKEGDRIYFDENHNIPEIQQMLLNSIGEEAEISLSDPHVSIGIAGYVAKSKKPINVADVSANAYYVELKNAAGGSQLSVPIMLDDDVFAILNIEHEELNAFDDQDLQTMLALCGIVSSIIDSKENDNALRVMLKGVRALTQTFEDVGNLDEVLEQIAILAYQLTIQKARKPDFAFAHVGIKQKDLLVYRAAHPRETLERFGESEYSYIDLGQYKKLDATGQPIRLGISGYAVVSGETQNVPDVGQHPHYLQVNLDRERHKRTINSQLAVPIKLANGVVIGVISIDHPSFAAFTEDDVQYVESLAEITAEVYRIRLQTEQRTRAYQVLRQSAQEINFDISQSMSIDVILKKITENAKKIISRDIDSEEDYLSHLALVIDDEIIFHKDHNIEHIYHAFHMAQLNRVYYRGPRAAERIGIVGRTAKLKETQLVKDVREDPDYFMISTTGTQLSVPIIVNDEVYAIISVEHRQPNYLTTEDKATLEALASQVGAVLTIFNSRLEQIRLEEREKQRSQYVSNVSHQMRGPLSNIDMFIQGIVDGHYNGFDDPLFVDNLNRIQRRIEDQRETIERLLQEARAEAGKVTPIYDYEDIDNLIKDVVEIYEPKAKRRKLRILLLSTKDIVSFYCDRFMIKSIVSNLIDNAIKYTEQGQITIRVQREDEQLIIVVEDTGIGISKSDGNRIFQHMNRGDNEAIRDQDGIGLGLHLAQRYVKYHDGQLTLDWSEPNKGSRFKVTLPITDVYSAQGETKDE